MDKPNKWTNIPVEEELYEKAHIDYNRVAIVRSDQTLVGQSLLFDCTTVAGIN